jgi:uncharacterized protein YjeT (DUF2065 family)
MLVFEGLLPFFSPGAGARCSSVPRKMSDGQIRFLGLTSMLIGLLLLLFWR